MRFIATDLSVTLALLIIEVAETKGIVSLAHVHPIPGPSTLEQNQSNVGT